MEITVRRRAVKVATAQNSEPWRALIETALIIAGLLALTILLPHTIYSDGKHRYLELAQLLDGRGFSTDKYSMIGPLFSAPLWYLGAVYRDSWWWLAHYNLVVFACGLGAIYWILKDFVERGLIRRFFLILIAASMFPAHIQDYYGETFTAVLIGVGLLGVAVGSSGVSWAVIAIGIANTPATLFGLVCTIAVHIWRRRKLRYALAVVATLGVIGLENWVRRGSPLNSRYEPGFTFPIIIGALSLLFSLGKGLIFFAPGLLLPVKQRLLAGWGAIGDRLWEAYILWIAFTAGLVLVYSHWYDWSGDWFWGPRFLLFASIPASFALAIRLDGRDRSQLANAITLAALILSFWVGVNGAIYGQAPLIGPCLSPTSPYTGVCQYAPQSSALWLPFLTGIHLDLKSGLYLLYSVGVFAYLSYPLARNITQHVSRAVVETVSDYIGTLKARFS